MRTNFSHRLLPALLLGSLPALAAPEPVSFNNDIQPVLSEYCYHCHGPDSSSRKPKSDPLRLDRKEFAFLDRETLAGPVIIKGDAEASEFYRRLITPEPDELMPPSDSHKHLEPEHIALFKRWIEEGAPYEEHWAFIPPIRPELPTLPKELQDWPNNPIDHFIAARAHKAGLTPNPEQAPPRLLRRIAFDLTGLPPTTAELDSFDPNASAETLDRYFASPAYGEQMARHWLDAARYGDTHGIHNDNYRSIWPYRDWVINAFNQKMPFDQFTVEQLAGDLLENPSLDQIVATGFNRCLATTGEGGSIPAEVDVMYAKDRVDTTAAIWLGLTTGCSSCHDHKFDPLTMKDFYSFTAFFRNSTMAALDKNKADHPPNRFVPARADRSRWEETATELSATEALLQERQAANKPEFKAWLTAASDSEAIATPTTPDFHLPLNDTDNKIRGHAKGQTVEWQSSLKRRDGPLGPAPLLSTSTLALGDVASLSTEKPFSYGAMIYVEGKPNGAVIARMNEADHYRGWDLWLQDGRIGAHIIQQWPDQGSKTVTTKPLKPGVWHHVMITYDPARKPKEAIAIFLNGTKQEATVEKSGLPRKGSAKIITTAPLTVGHRHGGGSIKGTVALQDFRLYRRLLPPEEISIIAQASSINGLLARAPANLKPAQIKTLRNYYNSSIDPQALALRKTKDSLTTEQAALRKRGAVTLIMDDRKDQEPFAHILGRGQYTNLLEKVGPDVPNILPPLPDSAPRNRLGLAHWLVDRNNPLPARVTVNRLWHQLFGRGLVKTTEDFGIMGSRPSHPDLLDWLAVEFMDSGWDYAHLLRTIVNSATYRQSQKISPAQLSLDPENILLTRGPRFRLDAEQIRDLALASSGLLINQVGGPSVKPYQPEGVWEAVAMKGSNTRFYKPDSGDNLYRRSLYTFWKRTAPHPAMEILNAPAREVFCVRRELTNTPLQAFVTMNDVQFVEASRQLAALALTASPDFSIRLNTIYRRLLSRPPRKEERPILEETLQEFLSAYQDQPEQAGKLITVGESTPDPSLDPAELAAWTLLASEVLNLDETLTK